MEGRRSLALPRARRVAKPRSTWVNPERASMRRPPSENEESSHSLQISIGTCGLRSKVSEWKAGGLWRWGETPTWSCEKLGEFRSQVPYWRYRGYEPHRSTPLEHLIGKAGQFCSTFAPAKLGRTKVGCVGGRSTSSTRHQVFKRPPVRGGVGPSGPAPPFFVRSSCFRQTISGNRQRADALLAFG